MAWETDANYAESRLNENTRLAFGLIRRDRQSRKAQILWSNIERGESEWVDLLNYRYGMSDEQIAADVKASGVPHEDWKEGIKMVMAGSVAKHNSKRK